MKALHYLLANRRSILIESAWMFVILLFSVGFSNYSAEAGSLNLKLVVFCLLFSIPGGIGFHLLKIRFKKG